MKPIVENTEFLRCIKSGTLKLQEHDVKSYYSCTPTFALHSKLVFTMTSHSKQLCQSLENDFKKKTQEAKRQNAQCSFLAHFCPTGAKGEAILRVRLCMCVCGTKLK